MNLRPVKAKIKTKIFKNTSCNYLSPTLSILFAYFISTQRLQGGGSVSFPHHNLPKRLEKSPFFNIMQQMDSVFNNVFKQFNHHLFALDMYETETNLIVEAKLPGYKQEQIKLDINGQHMRIAVHGSSHVEKSDDDTYHHRKETFQYQERWVMLPYVVSEKSKKETKVTFNDGVLSIAIPKIKTSPSIDSE